MLAIAKLVVGGLDAEAHKRSLDGHRPLDAHCLRTVCRKHVVIVLAGISLARAWVKQLNHGIHGSSLISGILQVGAQGHMVALTHKARQARLDHDGFLRNHLALKAVAVQCLVVADGLQNPGGVEFRRLKLDNHISVFVASEHRSPQGRLDVGLAQLDVIQPFQVFATDIHLGLIHRHLGIGCNRCRSKHL